MTRRRSKSNVFILHWASAFQLQFVPMSLCKLVVSSIVPWSRGVLVIIWLPYSSVQPLDKHACLRCLAAQISRNPPGIAVTFLVLAVKIMYIRRLTCSCAHHRFLQIPHPSKDKPLHSYPRSVPVCSIKAQQNRQL
ncbi:hypothetical protein K503DRAFT_157311 [Rhizopogon vinicolor AM-OR11-026]|uniref:Uncharacterized protein n=1 Tax=Rhizopogon vinicolor AM-OR11-026 TaxID=1314800 RepID=A0A1B7N0W9_9AGAM|nr:hypothetical protein K503DRAFT_157311 [Rhizopogon vinicolor AM-OR11-026]